MKQYLIPLIIAFGALLLVTPFSRRYFGDMDMSYGVAGIGAALLAGGIAALVERVSK